MFDFLKKLFPKRRKEEHSAEELRIAFKERYHHFKLLLNANNKALDIMAEIEEALKGTQPFGMSFIRERCTRASTNVYQIIKHLNDLAPGKYQALYDSFDEIREQISPYLEPRKLQYHGPLVVSLDDVHKDHADQVGAKMANLGEVRNSIGLGVPNGFVITAAAYQRFMDHNELQPEIDRRLQAAVTEELDDLYAMSAGLQQLIIGATIPPDLEAAILEHYHSLEEVEKKGCTVVMRSSALGEDLQRTTFAGQYRSALNVSGENILHVYKEVVASKYGLPAMTYRLNRGIRDRDVAMCVGCLTMVDAVSGGVLYSRDPINIRNDSIVIDCTWGLPKSVVDGSVKPDHFVIARAQPLRISQKEISTKQQKYICYPDEGVCRMEVTGEEGLMPSITDDLALELAHLATRLEEHYHAPQDIEWCVDKKQQIVILQCRPLMQIEAPKDASAHPTEETDYGIVLIHGGVTAAPGVAAGSVFIVRKDMDVLQFPDGGVLVTEQALPRWATLLNRAAAVITEQGSVAGHLANVAREFGVPALFSVKGAIDALSPGDMVTVDADTMKVYEGKVFELLKTEREAHNLMEGSAVYDALKGASQHIVHLNLLDPDAITFRADNCKTYHDITRFCHEKSVWEMFRFGKDHHFPERSSKRLVAQMPMQWWVLNLDDGFKEEVEGKHVQIENIASLPMLALWEGITAIPWGGPPPVDGKGLLSVMFQATQNTALATGRVSKYADRNYFMISKNYCSLTSRLGFHFSIVETLVSDRYGENYISFQFKGGAADYERRRKRIFFVKDILEGYHFRVDVKDDNLIARLEDFDKDFMVRSLKIVGYMAIHTRQLDMIMENNALVNYYRTKICKDIQDLFVREKVLYLYVGDEEDPQSGSEKGKDQ